LEEKIVVARNIKNEDNNKENLRKRASTRRRASTIRTPTRTP